MASLTRRSTGERPVPPIDRATPAQVFTATFAMG